MGVLYGLAAALCWGVGDFVITTLARHVGTAKSLLYIQLLSLASWIILLFVFPHSIAVPASVWGIAALAGIFHVIGLVTTYRAFEIGTLSFVSPIASSFAIVTAILFVISGNAPPGLALGGTVLLIIGVVIVTRSTTSDGPVTLKGVPEAIVSAIGFGVMFWLIDAYVREPLGDAVPLLLLKIMVTTYAVAAVVRSPKSEPTEALPSRSKLWLLALGAALLDSLAWVATLFGYKQAEHGAVVTAVASLFSIFTIVLAWMFLKERLNKIQWVGIAVVLVGILLVSLPKR